MEADKHPLIIQIRRVILKRGGNGGIRGLSRTFRIFDDNRDQKLSREELKTGLKDYGVILQPKELDQVATLFDRDGDGSVTVNEFIRAIKGPMKPAREQIISQIFDKFDRDNNGCVEVNDIRERYSVDKHPMVLNGTMTREQALTSFLSVFDSKTNPNGSVTRKEFFDYYSGVSCNIDNDEMFKSVVENAWKWGDNPKQKRGIRLDLTPIGEPVQTQDQLQDFTTSAFFETKLTFTKPNVPKRVIGYTGHVVAAQESVGVNFTDAEAYSATQESVMTVTRPPPPPDYENDDAAPSMRYNQKPLFDRFGRSSNTTTFKLE